LIVLGGSPPCVPDVWPRLPDVPNVFNAPLFSVAEAFAAFAWGSLDTGDAAARRSSLALIIFNAVFSTIARSCGSVRSATTKQAVSPNPMILPAIRALRALERRLTIRSSRDVCANVIPHV
jgi:hypothetical protein